MMSPEELRSKLHGVVSFPVTPFQPNYALDLAGLRRNLRALLEHPVSAVVAPAGTGEMFSLSPAEHAEVVETTLEEVNGRVPVLAATGINVPLAVELAKRSAELGVDGILALPPYYPNADEEGLFDYYSAIAKATPLGMIVYSRDWMNMSPSGVEKLTELPTLIAWKDGQGDMRRYAQIMARVGDRLHWIGGVGDDAVPGYYGIGVRTYTSSIANVSPKLSLALHELAAVGDSARLTPLMNQFVLPLYELRARRRGYEVTVMKEMMMMLGLAGGPVRPPLARMRPEELAELRAFTDTWKGWV